MCEVRYRGKTVKNKKKKKEKPKYSGQQQKEMDSDEPHLTPNEKTQPMQWTERPTAALVAAGSLWLLTQSQQPDEKTQLTLRTERPTGALVGAGSLWPFVFEASGKKKILTILPTVHLHSLLIRV
jgi:hypothetical protein